MQSMIGLNWLVSLIDDLKCFDTSTEARKSLLYARPMIEISFTKPFPLVLKVKAEGHDVNIDVHYKWKQIFAYRVSLLATVGRCVWLGLSSLPSHFPSRFLFLGQF